MSCVRSVRTALENTPGVDSANVDFATSTATITPGEGFDLTAAIANVQSSGKFGAKL